MKVTTKVASVTFHCLKSKLCSPGEGQATCKPNVLSKDRSSHVWIQMFGCVNHLEVVNYTRLMVCLTVSTKDFISPG